MGGECTETLRCRFGVGAALLSGPLLLRDQLDAFLPRRTLRRSTMSAETMATAID